MAAPRALQDDRKTREVVLDAAGGLFALNGYHGTSLAQICAEVGIAKSSLLHHFPSKTRIYAEVLERIAVELADLLAAAQAIEGAPATKFRGLIELYLDWTRRRPDYNQLILRELMDNAARADRVRRWVLKPVLDDMAQLIADAQADGAIRPVEPMLFLFHIVGGIAYVFAGRPTLAGIMDDMDQDELTDRYGAHVRAAIDLYMTTDGS